MAPVGDKIKESAEGAKKGAEGAVKTVRDALFPASTVTEDGGNGGINLEFLGFAVFAGVVIGFACWHYYNHMDDKKKSKPKKD